ncbi:MAG: insecticidal toxin complex protein, partial [Bacteroidales bacterium]|nr:insecticidal toxin complex protein [Bacteroidales bacterium]
MNEKTNIGNQGKDIKRLSAPSISLPKGGGAVKGIDEKFSVNPVNGTASLNVPVYTTPGRSDFHPSLSLQYDSGAGNGPFGLGWGLSIPSITRKTDKGLPRYRDQEDSDTFILSGAEDLVPALKWDVVNEKWKDDRFESGDGEYTIRRYRPQIEGLFARIEKWEHKTSCEVYWISVSKDNVTSIFGKSNNGRICDPKDNSLVFQWLLEESYDDRGNIIIYEYKAENDQNIDPFLPREKNRLTNGYANKYVKSVRYGNQIPYQKDGWHFEVVFDYGEHDPDNPGLNETQTWLARQDSFSSFRAGFEIRTQRLCQRVLMFHHFSDELEIAPYLVRSTNFSYKESPVVTYMTSVNQVGYKWNGDEYNMKSLPPLEFTYSEVELNEVVQTIGVESLENLPAGLDGRQYQWVDLDGEGISGILTEQGRGWFYKRNLGNVPFGPAPATNDEPPAPPLYHDPETVQFTAGKLITTKPSLASLQTGRSQVMDLAGDGQKDLVLLDDPVTGFFERSNDRRWNNFVALSAQPQINWNDPNLRFIDLNGDGHTDILISENDIFIWYPSKAEKGFGSPEYVVKKLDEEQGPTLVFADAAQSVYLADMSGDGLTDIVRIRNGEVCYWPNLGYGHFGTKVTMDNAPFFDSPYQFNQNRIRLADIDGSGTTDILYLSHNTVQIWFNQSGNGWSSLYELENFPKIDNLSSLMVIDLLGNGTACIVWSSPLPKNNGHPMCYIDLMGNKKPHLMLSLKNNMGAETTLQYASSVKFYLEDLAAGNPWITRLPFPVHVVERIETRELVTNSKFVMRYRYHHGYFDGSDREFRGFGLVEQWDTESYSPFQNHDGAAIKVQSREKEFHQPPVYTKTWYHTGGYQDRQNISQQYKDEYFKGESNAWLLPDTVLPSGLTAKEENDACRALKGSMLRQEIYAIDGSEQSKNPYQITESNYEVKWLQPMQNFPHAVFFTHDRETLNYYYERNPDDPRINHNMVLEVDNYGNLKKTAEIGYPRRTSHDLYPGEQTRPLILYKERNYFNQEDGGIYWYRAGVPTETKNFELTLAVFQEGYRKFEINEINNFLNDQNLEEIPYEEISGYHNPQIRCIEHNRIIYYKDNLEGPLPLNQVESLAIPYENYTLVFTPGLLEHIFGTRIDESLLINEGQYRKGATLKSQGIFPEDDADDLWWIPSGIQIFNQTQFYLPVKVIDPFNAETTIEYDDYTLTPLRTVDPLGSIVNAE